MKEIERILMERDGMTQSEARSLIQEAKDQFDEYILDGDMSSAEDICNEYFGLEQDYLIHFM